MKRFHVLIAMVLTTLAAYAQHITEQEAMERALQFIRNGKTSVATGGMAAPKRNGNIKLESALVEASSLYAFNLEGGGFIIASADSRTLPVFGYSTSGSIDWEQMPDNIREWIKSYDEAVATLGNSTNYNNGKLLSDFLQSDTPQERDPVEPLIKTHWNQYEPYWDLTPVYKGPRSDLKGKKCLTGCAPTAFAQILNYYQYPKTMPNGLPDYNACIDDVNNDQLYNYNIDALPPVAFDWDNMLDDYTLINPETGKKEDVGTPQQRLAVATLMRYCGQALKAGYSPEGTACYYYKYQDVFNNIFGYPAAIKVERKDYSIDEWEEIIYGELAAGRPVEYGGDNEEAGHAFICDGYDGYGFFHINWGWGGSGDGYFSLSVLNPQSNTNNNIGSDGIGFSRDQLAVIYLDPAMEIRPKPESSKTNIPIVFQDQGMIVKDANTVVYYYEYDGEDVQKAVADYALGTPGKNGTWLPLFMGDPNDSIIYITNGITMEIDSTVFQPGDSVTLYPLFRFRKDDAQWQVIQPLESHVVTGRTDQGSFFITVHGPKKIIECISGFISKGTGKLTERNDLTIVLKNNSDWDYQEILYLLPKYYGHIDPSDITDNTPYTNGDELVCGSYIRAKQESEVTFSFVPKQAGYTKFLIIKPNSVILDEFSLELNNDTLLNYDKYVENRSYFACEDGQWIYHVELCDRAGVEIPNWIPVQNIRLRIRTVINDEIIDDLRIFDGIREYLTALPEKGGNGDYKFTYKIPINISLDGTYAMDSYLSGWYGNDMEAFENSCYLAYSFQYSNPTGVMPTVIHQTDETYYDLLGRKVEGIPDRKGLYIQNGKKVYIP